MHDITEYEVAKEAAAFEALPTTGGVEAESVYADVLYNLVDEVSDDIAKRASDLVRPLFEWTGPAENRQLDFSGIDFARCGDDRFVVTTLSSGKLVLVRQTWEPGQIVLADGTVIPGKWVTTGLKVNVDVDDAARAVVLAGRLHRFAQAAAAEDALDELG